jgi:hypothetical protein
MTRAGGRLRRVCGLPAQREEVAGLGSTLKCNDSSLYFFFLS